MAGSFFAGADAAQRGASSALLTAFDRVCTIDGGALSTPETQSWSSRPAAMERRAVRDRCRYRRGALPRTRGKRQSWRSGGGDHVGSAGTRLRQGRRADERGLEGIAQRPADLDASRDCALTEGGRQRRAYRL